ncbi:hypothetical protein BHE74_00050082 [Ensete ventricosum]|nr:hypothetical protein GW17_00003841 [Ensete ventricosum]RWW44180.1 hypothetical protein BHE74_00050082 [Ensete ventricosum]
MRTLLSHESSHQPSPVTASRSAAWVPPGGARNELGRHVSIRGPPPLLPSRDPDLAINEPSRELRLAGRLAASFGSIPSFRITSASDSFTR